MSDMAKEELIGFIDDEIVAERGRANACKHDIPKYLCRQNIETLKQLRRIVEQHFEIKEQQDRLEKEQLIAFLKGQGDMGLMSKIGKMMFDWDKGNFTICPNCGVDDFTHVEGCKFENDNIITRLAKLLSQPKKVTAERIFETIQRHITCEHDDSPPGEDYPGHNDVEYDLTKGGKAKLVELLLSQEK